MHSVVLRSLKYSAVLMFVHKVTIVIIHIYFTDALNIVLIRTLILILCFIEESEISRLYNSLLETLSNRKDVEKNF